MFHLLTLMWEKQHQQDPGVLLNHGLTFLPTAEFVCTLDSLSNKHSLLWTDLLRSVYFSIKIMWGITGTTVHPLHHFNLVSYWMLCLVALPRNRWPHMFAVVPDGGPLSRGPFCELSGCCLSVLQHKCQFHMIVPYNQGKRVY